MWRISLFGLLVLASASAGEENVPKEGTYYKYEQLGVKKTQIEGNRINLVFKPNDEQFHWCPGIRVQTTKKATVVTFVRCKTSQTCGIDKKAAIGKRLIRTVSIDTSGLDVYVRNGDKKFKRIYKSPNTKAKSDGKQKVKTKTKSTSKSGSQKRTATLIKPAEDHVLRRHVKNYLLKPYE